MSRFSQKLNIGNYDSILNPVVPSRNALEQWQVVRQQIRENVYQSQSSSSRDLRDQAIEPTSLQKMHNTQTKGSNRMLGITSQTPQNQIMNFQNDFRQLNIRRKDSNDSQIKSPTSAFTSPRIPIKPVNLDIFEKKMQEVPLTIQNYQPQSPTIEKAQESVQMLQQKLQNLRSRQDQTSLNFEKIKNDMYYKMGVSQTRQNTNPLGNQRQQQQFSITSQSPSVREEIQSLRKQLHPYLQQEQSSQDSQQSAGRESQECIRYQTQDFKNPKQKIIFEKEELESYRENKQNQVINKNQLYNSKPLLEEILTLEKIRKIQVNIIECNDGNFENLPNQQDFIQVCKRLISTC